MPTTVKGHHQASVAQHDKPSFLSHITVGCKLVCLQKCVRNLGFFHFIIQAPQKHGLYDNHRGKQCGHAQGIFSQQVSKEYIISAYNPLVRIQSRGHNRTSREAHKYSLLLCSGKGKKIYKQTGIFCHSP